MSALESPVMNGVDDKFGVQNSALRQDLSMPPDEDFGSPIDCSDKLQRSLMAEPEDPNGTISGESNCTTNSECDITVIHVPTIDDSGHEIVKDTEEDGMPIADSEKKDYGLEGKDSKDGSDSGVEGCAIEQPRMIYVQGNNGWM